jgi:hypothetical protein
MQLFLPVETGLVPAEADVVVRDGAAFQAWTTAVDVDERDPCDPGATRPIRHRLASKVGSEFACSVASEGDEMVVGELRAVVADVSVQRVASSWSWRIELCRLPDESRDRRRLVVVDFDGVLHSYSSGWEGPGIARDAPVPGAIAWLESLVADGEGSGEFAVAVSSARSSSAIGRRAVREWLLSHGLSERALSLIAFPVTKPRAFVTIDDRVIQFRGEFPSVSEIAGFEPWWKASQSD